jgi:S1-C subfamily serine protease
VTDGPAAKAGIKGSGTDSSGELAKGGEIITSIDNKTVNTITELSTYVKSKNAGDVVSLTVNRGGTDTIIQVTLGAKPTSIQSNTNPDNTQPTPEIPGFNGKWHYRYVPIPDTGN